MGHRRRPSTAREAPAHPDTGDPRPNPAHPAKIDHLALGTTALEVHGHLGLAASASCGLRMRQSPRRATTLWAPVLGWSGLWVGGTAASSMPCGADLQREQHCAAASVVADGASADGPVAAEADYNDGTVVRAERSLAVGTRSSDPCSWARASTYCITTCSDPSMRWRRLTLAGAARRPRRPPRANIDLLMGWPRARSICSSPGDLHGSEPDRRPLDAPRQPAADRAIRSPAR